MNKMIKKLNIKENALFFILLLLMAIYYGVMLFTNKPWYDELYTYYSFISRGPVYAAIHWPVPNNHVGYSVLSAFLDYFGNPYIGLRGISYVSSLLNMVLLYSLAKHFMNKTFSLITVMLYISNLMVNSLAIQGRGYMLSTACYLVALLSLYHICLEKERKRDYVIFALSLTMGLYTLPSSTFWVIPCCMVGGLYLLGQKEYKKLIRLIAVSIMAALLTFFLYTLIWLAIGSNLLSKNPESIFYGVYQVKIILKAPVKAFLTGVEYMTSTPYIQSMQRSIVVTKLFSYFTSLFSQYFNGMGKAITIFLGITMVVAVVMGIRKRGEKGNASFFTIYIALSFVLLPVMLIVQSVQPYLRVFSYFAIPFSLVIAYCLFLASNRCLKEKRAPIIGFALTVFMLIFTSVLLLSDLYRLPLAGRENDIVDLLRKEEKINDIYYTDDFQKYVMKFYYDWEPEEKALVDAGYVMVAKDILDENYKQAVWPVLIGHDDLDYAYIVENFDKERENESYILYKRKE